MGRRRALCAAVWAALGLWFGGFGPPQGGGAPRGFGRPQGGPTGFGPAQGTSSAPASAVESLAGLRLWLNAAASPDPLTVTSSPDVDSWRDDGGGSHDYSQGTADNKPHASTIGSAQAALFDGSNDYMSATPYDFADGAAGVALVAFKLTSIPALDVSTYAYALNVHVGTTDYFMLGVRNVGGNAYATLIWRSAAGVPRHFYGSTALAVDTAYVVEVGSDGYGSNYYMTVNGVAQTLTWLGGLDDGAWLDYASQSWNYHSLGANRNGGVNASNFAGAVGEVVVCAGAVAPDSSARAAAVAEIMARWGAE